MGTMNRSYFPKDLEEGLNAHFGMAFKEHPEEYTQFLDEESTNKAFIEDVLETGFGAAPTKAEGAAFAEDEGGQGWVARYTMETVGSSFSITREAIDDNLYQSLGPKYAKALARSLKHTREIKSAAILNRAVTSGYNGGDGVVLLSTAHPLRGGGTASNKLATPADLMESSLEDISIMIRKCTDDRGIPIALNPLRLVLPPELEFTGIRVTQSQLRPGGNENDINAIRYKGLFGTAPAIITRLTDTDAWFVKTDCPEGMKFVRRQAVRRGMQEDFRTGNAEYKAYERYATGWSDWRAVFGSEGA